MPGPAMWWGAAVYVIMTGCVCGVTGSKDTILSIPTSPPRSETPTGATTSPTVELTPTLPTSSEDSSNSSLSKARTLSSTLTLVNVSQSEIPSPTSVTSSSDFFSHSVSVTSPDSSDSIALSPSSVNRETFITSLPFSLASTLIATSDFSESLKKTDSDSTTISRVPATPISDFSVTERSRSDFGFLESSSSLPNSDFGVKESSSTYYSDFSVTESRHSTSVTENSLIDSRSSISIGDNTLIHSSSASGSEYSVIQSSYSDLSVEASSSLTFNSDNTFPERSTYQSLSETATASVPTPSLPTHSDMSPTISSSAIPSSFTSLKNVAVSPTDSEVAPSTQFPITHSSSVPYPAIESSMTISLLSSHVPITAETATGSGLASSAVHSSTLTLTSSPADTLSSQTIGAVTELLSSHSQIVSSESSSVLVTTPPKTETTSVLETVTIQKIATPLSISPTSTDHVASPSSTLLTGSGVSKSRISSSVFTSAPGSGIVITSTSAEGTSLPHPPSSVQTSSSASSPPFLRSSTASVPIHSISFTVDKIVPESTSISLADVTSKTVLMSSDVHHVISTTVHAIATTPTSDTDTVNHTFEMVLKGNCKLLEKDKMILKAFWDQLREKIIKNLEYKYYLVTPGNFSCNPLRISFTVHHVPMISLKSISTSLEALVGNVNITVTVSGKAENYQLLKLNMAPTVNADEPNDAELQEIDLIIIIAAGALCFILISAGLVICVREYYSRRRTRTFELANKYQGEDFTLTKIPRPAINYTEKDVDVQTNDHVNGDPNDTERLMDSIHLRVNTNENGLMIGITGTLERQKAELDSSPPTSTAGSEHLQFPLVPKETESLQSQDNPIYYIDDEQMD